MKRTSDFDGALKDLFQHDRPLLLERVAGGVPVKEFLNVELPRLQERRADLVVLLADESILHLEFQSANDAGMPYRMAMYHLLLVQQYRRPLRHVVLYVGSPGLTMPARLDTGPMQFAFDLTDIREIEAAALLRSRNPADYALAILAGGGRPRLREIVGKIAHLRGAVRDRAIAQMIVLSGLRAYPREVLKEVEQMSVVIDWRKNPVLVEWWHQAVAEGREEGREEVLKCVRMLLIDLLQIKFGKLTKRALDRVNKAPAAQVSKWAKKVVTAETLEGVLGPRQRW